MPTFSERDINEAKKRVREMQNRASHYIGDEGNQKIEHKKDNKNEVKRDIPDSDPAQDEVPAEENDKSSLVILALILILSKEGADNMLILALLYLLL